MAVDEPKRWVVIDGRQSPETITGFIVEKVNANISKNR